MNRKERIAAVIESELTGSVPPEDEWRFWRTAVGGGIFGYTIAVLTRTKAHLGRYGVRIRESYGSTAVFRSFKTRRAAKAAAYRAYQKAKKQEAQRKRVKKAVKV